MGAKKATISRLLCFMIQLHLNIFETIETIYRYLIPFFCIDYPVSSSSNFDNWCSICFGCLRSVTKIRNSTLNVQCSWTIYCSIYSIFPTNIFLLSFFYLSGGFFFRWQMPKHVFQLFNWIPGSMCTISTSEQSSSR